MKMKKILLLVLFLLFSKSAFSAETYAKGDEVEALWHGPYKALIWHVMKEDLYKVHFYGYWHNRDEIMRSDLLRKRPKRESPAESDLKSGDAVEFMQGDHWKPAVFVEMQGKKALLRYADGEKTREERVPVYKLWKVDK
ncbi:MAG: hypothetical protein U1F57_09125 [bacterium]